VGKLNLWCILILLLVTLLPSGCGGGKKKQVDQGEAHYILGLSYLQENNPSLALKEFRLAAQSKPESAHIQAALAQAYYLKKAFPEAEEHYLQALKLDRDNSQVENNLAVLYLDMERWNDAIRYFRKASSDLTFTRAEVALTGLGYAYLQKGEYLAAVTACKEALAHNLKYPPAHLRLGEAYYALDKTDLAIEAFRQALSLAPDYSAAHYRLALARMKSGETEKAIASFRDVIRLAPDSEQGRLSVDYLKLLN